MSLEKEKARIISYLDNYSFRQPVMEEKSVNRDTTGNLRSIQSRKVKFGESTTSESEKNGYEK